MQIDLDKIEALPLAEKVGALNAIRWKLHQISPFKSEPIDFVEWVVNEEVHANDYNPNSVAPPEMELLRVSIMEDGFTQPIVSNEEEKQRIVIDGFHRNRVGKECEDVKNRIHGYLPIVQIRSSQTDTANRIASTIRHNRARGKHSVERMSEIVTQLKRHNWSDKRICEKIGLDKEEMLRLYQIDGLLSHFSTHEYSDAKD